MLAKITTPIALFKMFQTMKAGAAMKRDLRREERKQEEFNGQRRHFEMLFETPISLPFHQTTIHSIFNFRYESERGIEKRKRVLSNSNVDL